MLRLDSMLLLVQLHIRSALKAQGLPEINIICEKLAIAGVTRFEDRFRLPLGISVNLVSYAAKLLVQTAADPEHGMALIRAFGRSVELAIIDAGKFAEKGAALVPPRATQNSAPTELLGASPAPLSSRGRELIFAVHVAPERRCRKH